ncbi:MAG: hypothetical protein AB1Y25_08945 [Cycloclasticus sp.]
MNRSIILAAVMMTLSTAANAHPGHGELSHPMLLLIGAVIGIGSFYGSYKLKMRLQKKTLQQEVK